MIKVVLPELGQGINKATVSFWYVAKGQRVREKEDLVELTTDKAAFNLPSPCPGVITEIYFQEGAEVKSGEALAQIDEKL
jgi:2-oxoglutarate dehydrogenase E2 component (dihydrolipoamide succinyltransferase)